MKVGRIIGTVTPAVIQRELEGIPMLLLQPLSRDGEERGYPVVAADPTRMAGPGETVYYESSREAALACDPWFVPVDHAVIGIVDEVHLNPEWT